MNLDYYVLCAESVCGVSAQASSRERDSSIVASGGTRLTKDGKPVYNESVQTPCTTLKLNTWAGADCTVVLPNPDTATYLEFCINNPHVVAEALRALMEQRRKNSV